MAVAVLAVGWALHAFAVVARGLAAYRVPWGNLYEFMTTGALVITTVYLLFLFRKDLRFVGTFVTGLTVAMMCAATMGSRRRWATSSRRCSRRGSSSTCPSPCWPARCSR